MKASLSAKHAEATCVPPPGRRLLLCLAALIVVAASSAFASTDVIFLSGGGTRSGSVRALTADSLKVDVFLPPRPGDSGPPPKATVSIPRGTIELVEFGSDAALDRLLAQPPSDAAPDLATAWANWEAFLAFPKSPAGKVALAYGESLLAGGKASSASTALDLFSLIEKQAWDPAIREMAKQGRLRAMIASGRASEAVGEAKALAAISEDPAVLIQAKYILASAADTALRKLVEDNPRWQEDIHVIPERNRLYNEALDEYLYPALFLGSESAAAARGLWGAAGVYRSSGEDARARECARDLLALYPDSPEAKDAQKFLETLPKALLDENPETDAKNAGSAPAPAPTEKSKTKKTKKNEKT